MQMKEECCICFETMSGKITDIPCSHGNKFHTLCLRQLNNDKCPLCRQPMGINKMCVDEEKHDIIGEILRDQIREELELAINRAFDEGTVQFVRRVYSTMEYIVKGILILFVSVIVLCIFISVDY